MTNLLPIRKLLRFSRTKILKLKRSVVVKFDDGDIKLNYKEVIITACLLHGFDKLKIPLETNIIASLIKKDSYFNHRTFVDMYSIGYKLLINKYRYDKDVLDTLDEYFQLLFKNIEYFNNKFITSIVEYAPTLEADDLIEIQLNEDILASIVKVTDEPTEENVLNSYDVISNTIDSLKDSPVRLFYKSGYGKKDQVNQILGPRGFVTEIDGRVFKTPMTNSFLLGFKDMYEAVIESRAGAKALLKSGKAIQDSEYMSRVLQLPTMSLERVVIGSCENPEYVNFNVLASDFNGIVGKHALINGKEVILTEDLVDNLAGTTIKIRSALYCSLPDKRTICSHCLGEAAYYIGKGHNVGHKLTIDALSKITQALLSTKHLLITAKGVVIKLNDTVNRHLMLKEGNKLFIRSNTLKNKKVILIVKQQEAKGLRNISDVKDVLTLNTKTLSSVEEITIKQIFKTKTTETVLPITVGKARARFTMDFVNYIHHTGYNVINEDEYGIDVTNLPLEVPVFEYEDIEYDYSSIVNDFKKQFNTKEYYVDEETGKLRSTVTPEVMTEQLYRLVNSKLDVRLEAIEIMVQAFIARDIDNGNYDSPRNSGSKNLISLKNAIEKRSLGPAFNWDNFMSKITTPISFKDHDKQSSVMDVYLAPHEVVKYES